VKSYVVFEKLVRLLRIPEVQSSNLDQETG